MFGWVRVRGSEVTEAIGMRELLCPIRKCSKWLMEDGSAVEVIIKRILVMAPMVRLYSHWARWSMSEKEGGGRPSPGAER
jgi:hypothetical protein